MSSARGRISVPVAAGTMWKSNGIAVTLIMNYSYGFILEGPRSRSYGHTAALRLLVQPCNEDERSVFFHFSK
jgi:hypothetical protein